MTDTIHHSAPAQPAAPPQVQDPAATPAAEHSVASAGQGDAAPVKAAANTPKRERAQRLQQSQTHQSQPQQNSGVRIPYLPGMEPVADADSLTAAADSTAVLTERDSVPVIVIEPSAKSQSAPMRKEDTMIGSWLLVAVLGVFCIVCLRFKSNKKYFSALLRDLTSVRERGNAFDDTVRETSFKILLNLLCAVSCGLLLFVVLGLARPEMSNTRFAWSCLGACALYSAVMPIVYKVCGTVFSQGKLASMWVQGFVASQALLGIMLLAPVLIALFYTAAAEVMAIISVIVFIIVKIIFIFKGCRIFFAQLSSWVLFLYYLCILEIIPIIGTVSAAFIIYR